MSPHPNPAVQGTLRAEAAPVTSTLGNALKLTEHGHTDPL